jgi:predicted nucleotidyltransferase
LINARNQLLDNALKYFLSQPEVKAIFIAGSLAAGTTDEFSDIDLRVVVAHEDHQQFIVSRLAAPKQWGDFLYHEWVKDAIHCVSHFKPFNKIDEKAAHTRVF